MKQVSQLIKGISRVPQKLLKCFDGTVILTCFVLQSAQVFPVIFILFLNDLEFVKRSFESSV